MKLKNRIPIFAALLFAGIVLTSTAQEGNAPNAPGQRPPLVRRPPGGPGQVRPMEVAGPVLNVLTEEQRASLQQAMQAQREQLRELNTKLREARRELLLAGLDGKFDEAAVRKQAMAVAGLEAELAVLRARALSQIQPPLTSGQIEKIRNAPPGGPGPGAGDRPVERPARRRILSDAPRDENGLPPKQ